MNTRIAWPGDGAYGTENGVLFNEVLWRGLYNLGCEVNKKGIYIALSSIKIMKKNCLY